MAEYKSNYTGQEIDAGIGKANTALQEHQSLKTVNGNSLVGTGNIVIEGSGEGLSSVAHDNTLTGSGTNASPLGVDITKIAQKSDIPDTSDFITKDVDDLDNYTKTSDLGDLAVKDTVDYETEVTNKPTIPSEVTESTVAGWGFTKNTGTYSKPSGGIPKTDLADAVQTSLGKADTAIQEDKYLDDAEIVDDITSITEDIEVEFGRMSTATKNIVALDKGSYWTTYDEDMETITGSALSTITLKAGTAGTVTIRGYDTEIPTSATVSGMAALADDADTNGYNIMVINAVAGVETYDLDGTDNRVTIVTQSAIDSCPPCIGISLPTDTGVVVYNYGDITGEPYRHFISYNRSGSYVDKPDPANSLAFALTGTKTRTTSTKKLVLTMNDDSSYEVVLPNSGGGDSSHESFYKDKTISILGDSISTFEGYIPEGNAVYYTGSNAGVSSVDDTWWMKTINSIGMTLNINNSWSGSRVTTTNGDESAGCMTRCQNLGTTPDVIIVYMGINDFNNEVALGTYDGNGTFPVTTTTFREAYAIMLNKIMTAYPRSKVLVCTLPPCERNGSTGAPEINGNDVLLDDFNKAIRNLAQVFGAQIIELAQCGLTYQNMNIYMGDWSSSSSQGLHPNAQGHSLMANEVIDKLDPVCQKYQ